MTSSNVVLISKKKKQRKAECERGNLKESQGRLLAPGQVCVIEKGTMQGSTWSKIQYKVH